MCQCKVLAPKQQSFCCRGRNAIAGLGGNLFIFGGFEWETDTQDAGDPPNDRVAISDGAPSLRGRRKALFWNPGLSSREPAAPRGLMRKPRSWLLTWALGTGFFCCGALAQDQPNSSSKQIFAAYDVKRETTLVGTVEAYHPASETPPLGARGTLQTSSGSADVHLGDARLLAANHFNIQTGDTLRIIGETVAFGKSSQYVARIIEKGTQALAVRTIRGLPLSYRAPRDGTQPKAPGGVL